MSGLDLLDDARRTVPEISVEELRRLLDAGVGLELLDVRDHSELDAGSLPGAVSIPRGHLELEVEARIPRHRPVVVYCAEGIRSLLAAKTLQALGYTKVWSLAGGFDQWKRSGGPSATPRQLTGQERSRYRRQVSIPEVGEEGQLELLASKVLCIGAGALGSPSALYLAAAGVGTLGIIDDDVVDESNLQRQILHATDRVGMPKTASAAKTIQALNPGVRVIEHRARLTRENALEILAGYDLVVDGCDNFSTRYLVNDACVMLRKPSVHGSVFRFEGQVTTFVPGDGPCYRCLFPEPPPADFAPTCQEAGVLGVVPGIIGSLQAVEALKLLLRRGRPLVGRLVVYDALEQTFRELRYKRDPSCIACGPVKMTELPEYGEVACALLRQ